MPHRYTYISRVRGTGQISIPTGGGVKPKHFFLFLITGPFEMIKKRELLCMGHNIWGSGEVLTKNRGKECNTVPFVVLVTATL